MQKSLFSKDTSLFLERLIAARKRAGLTQEQLAKRLNATQSFVSKCERGERRLDIIELRNWCSALRLSLPSFVAELESHLKRKPGA